MRNPSHSATFGHVLCWVDGSEEACRAAERAAHLAFSLGAKLTFLAVGTRPQRSEGFDAYARIERVSAPMPTMIDRNAAACLDQAMVIAAQVGATRTNRLTRTGDAVTAICSAARSEGADLLVIRRGRSNLLERLFGASVSDALANRCEFAVLSDG